MFFIPSRALLVIDLLVLFHFAAHWLWRATRTGRPFSYWHIQILMVLVIPLFLSFPFAGAALNILAVGSNLDAIQKALPAAFSICVLGYVSLYSMYYLTPIFLKITGPSFLRKPLAKLTYRFINSELCLRTHWWIAGLSGIILLGFVWLHYGVTFNIRQYALENGSLRPIAGLFYVSYLPLIAQFLFISYLSHRHRRYLTPFTLLLVVLLPYGARSGLVAIFLVPLIVVLCLRGTFRHLIMSVACLPLIVFAGIYLSQIRSGIYSPITTVATFLPNIAYGNTFSDLRDFSWVLGDWDGQYLHGRSYLAALMGMVPSTVVPFRRENEIGVFTVRTAGLDEESHGGIRPGSFGEAYFNFGLVGVLGIGMLLGFVFRSIDIHLEIESRRPKPDLIRAFSFTIAAKLAGNIAITAQFWENYIVIGVLVSGWVIRDLHRLYWKHVRDDGQMIQTSSSVT